MLCRDPTTFEFSCSRQCGDPYMNRLATCLLIKGAILDEAEKAFHFYHKNTMFTHSAYTS